MRSQGRVVGVALGLLACAPGLAAAAVRPSGNSSDGTGAATSRAGDVPREAAGENEVMRYRVATTLDRALPDGCRYRGIIRGEVQQVQPRNTPDERAASYLPDLRIQAGIQCSDGTRVSTGERRLTQPQPSRARLEQAVRLHAEVTRSYRGRSCHYAPTVALVERTLRLDSVTSACQFAYGGGPR